MGAYIRGAYIWGDLYSGGLYSGFYGIQVFFQAGTIHEQMSEALWASEKLTAKISNLLKKVFMWEKLL